MYSRAYPPPKATLLISNTRKRSNTISIASPNLCRFSLFDNGRMSLLRRMLWGAKLLIPASDLDFVILNKPMKAENYRGNNNNS